MKTKVTKNFPILSIIIGSVLLLGVFTYIGFKSGSVEQADNKKVTKMQYVLVNEDQGTVFEGKKYSLGTDFVTLINQDTANLWETTTRDIASRGIEEGQFDAQIIIPQDFSERLLALESIDPEQALVEYQVREGQNEITNQTIQGQVNDVLKDFSQRIVQMYFSSIVGNLSEAQQQVNQIVGLEQNYQNVLESTIYTPFKEIPTSYESVLGTASVLDEENQFFTVEQQAFVAAVKDLMESNNNDLKGNAQGTEEVQQAVNQYADDANEKLTTSIEQFNQQFDLHKQQLAEQWQADLSDYQQQYDGLADGVNKQLNGFWVAGLNGEADSGVYTSFLTNAYAFQATQTARIEELVNGIEELEERVKELTALKATVAETYYNDPEATPETASEEQVKNAILNLMVPLDRQPELKSDGAYLTAVTEAIKQVEQYALPAPADFTTLITRLVADGALTQMEADKLTASYDIVTRYQPTLTGSGSQFNLLNNEEKADRVSDFTVTNTVKMSLKPDSTQHLQFSYSFNPGSDGSMELMNLATIRDNLEQSLQSQLVNSDYMATVVVNGLQLDIGMGLKDPATSSQPPKMPTKEEFSYTFDSQIRWLYPDDASENEYFQGNYAWTLEGVQATGQVATYIDKDQALKQDLSGLFGLFASLTSAAEKVVTIYADPANLEVGAFATYLKEHPDQGFDQLAAADSVYWLYNNVTEDKKANQISTALYQDYRMAGDQLYQELTAQINKLNATIGTKTADEENPNPTPTLYGTLQLMTAPEMMLKEADTLGAWFEEANQEIETVYSSWQEAEKIAPQSIITDEQPHPEKNDTKAINGETENLVKNIQALVASSTKIAQSTEEAAAEVKDVAPTIKTLKQSTDKVQTEATTILTNLNNVVAEVQATTAENNNYAATFSQVLANTKNGGADNETVFNFLANPIQGKGDFGSIRQTSLVPYYATVISAFLIFLVAIGMQKLMASRRLTEDDALLRPSRVWYNTPNIVRILVVSGILASLFAFNLLFVIDTNAEMAWFSYSFLVMFAGLLLTIGLMRQYRLLALYLYSGFLGLFFMLTPLLGVVTKKGSLSNLLYRLSPLQNIQNGFTTLTNGGTVSWVSYLILLVVVAIGLVLNLWVKPEVVDKEPVSR